MVSDPALVVDLLHTSRIGALLLSFKALSRNLFVEPMVSYGGGIGGCFDFGPDSLADDDTAFGPIPHVVLLCVD